MTVKNKLGLRKAIDIFTKVFACAATLLGVVMLCWILFVFFEKGIDVLSLTFLIEPTKPYGIPDSGIANAFVGTFFITSGAAAIGVPTGLLAGIYLAEFAGGSRFAKAIKFFANVMMGVPSIIIGLFVYSIMIVGTGKFSGFAGSVALAIIMFPVVLRTTEDMLAMVPNELRESALAVGLPRWRVTLQIVFKAAGNGLVTGVLLAIARVGGETAPLLFTALWSDSWPWNYFNGPTPSMTIAINEDVTVSPFESMQARAWGAALIVTVMILIVNLSSRYLFGGHKK